MRKHISGDVESTRGYSRAVVVSGGKTIYLAGFGAPVDKDGKSLAGNFAAQVHGSFAELIRNLEAVGGTLSNVVTMTVFITDSRHGPEFLDIHKRYFPDGKYPASALIGVTSLALPEMMIEIQAIAVVDD